MNDNNFIIYGLNNSYALLSSNKYNIISINILLNSIASKDSSLIEKISSLELNIQYLDKNKYNLKYDFKHTQGIVIEFNGNILQEFNIINKTKDNIHIEITAAVAVVAAIAALTRDQPAAEQ